MAAHRYWRLNLTAVTNPGTDFALAEVKFCTAVAGASVTSGGTASASSIFSGSFPASNAFDSNITTFWHSAGGTAPQWIKYDFGLGNDKDIIEVGIVPPSSRAHQQPVSFDVQWSDDNSTWTTAWSVADTEYRYTSSTSAQGQVEKRYTNPSVGGKTYWRIHVTNVDSSSDTFGVNEAGFALSISGATVTTGGIPLATSQFSTSFTPANAYDASSGTRYASRETLATAVTMGFPLALGYHWSTAQAVVEVIIENRSDGSLANEGKQAPESFDLQSSTDGENWTTEWSKTGITWTSQGQVQRFSAVSLPDGTGDMEFAGVTMDGLGTVDAPDQIGTGGLQFSGVSMDGNGVNLSVDQVRQFWTFGI